MARLTDSERIKLELDLDVERAKVKIDRLGQTVKQVGNFSAEYRQKMIETKLATEQLANAEMRRADGLQKLGKSMSTMTNHTGLATSSALELGRVVSDAPYGIRGMANNVSQLSSMLFQLSGSTNVATGSAYGFSGALKAMWASLMGPMGVLLLIQGGIALLDHFAGSTKKAEEATTDWRNTLDSSAVKLMVALDALEDNNVALDDKVSLLDRVNETYDDLNISVDEFGKLTDESTEALKKKTQALLDEAKANALAKLIEEEYAEQFKLQSESAVESLDNWDLALLTVERAVVGFGFAVEQGVGMAVKNQNEALKDSEEKIGKYMEFMKEKLPEGGILAELLFGNPEEPNTKKKREKALRDWEATLLDLSKLTVSWADKERQTRATTKEEELQLASDIRDAKIQAEYDAWLGKEQIRLEKRIKEIEDSTKSEAEKSLLIEEANNLHNNAIVSANDEKNRALLQSDTLYYAQVRELMQEQTQGALAGFETWLSTRNEMLNSEVQHKGEMSILNEEGNLGKIMQQMALNEKMFELDTKEHDRRMKSNQYTDEQKQQMEQKQQGRAQAFAKHDLALEKKKAKAKEAIIGQLGDAIIAIAGEGSAVAKGVAIAQTLWSTYSGVMSAINMQPFTPYNYVQAVAVGIMGASQVAKILQTKSPVEKGGQSAGGGASSATFTPNFNVVGNSATSQITDTINNKNDATKAYVVYDDIAKADDIQKNSVGDAGL